MGAPMLRSSAFQPPTEQPKDEERISQQVASMAAEQGMHVSSLTWVLVLAAGSCFTTPLGYQTNMMVMKDGGYTFTDFMRYGFPVQCIHMVLTMIAIWLISDVLGFEGFQ